MEMVRYLVEEMGCDPMINEKKGKEEQKYDDALYLAVKSKNLELV